MQFIFGTLCVFKGRLFRTLLCVHIKLLASIEHLSVYFRCIYYFRLNLIFLSLFFFNFGNFIIISNYDLEINASYLH